VGNELFLRGLLGSIDGTVMIRDEVRGRCGDAENLGTALAENILSRGGADILKDVYEKGDICGEKG
jgi:hydroxymethylbilane synthase